MNQANDKYSWDPAKREENIKERGLDIVELADFIFADPGLRVRLDDRADYGEPRYLGFAMIQGERFLLCFTPRGELIHLITVYRQHDDEEWRKNYDNI
jgi:uncharacterized DUF497 family protein